jgi:membrane protease YdiL (CAAX protease family)
MVKTERYASLLVVGIVVAANIIELGRLGTTIAFAIMAACLAITLTLRSWNVWPTALLFVLMYAYWLVAPGPLRQLPALNFLIPYLLTLGIVKFVKYPKAFFSWYRFGRMDLLSKVLVVTTGIASTAALISWALWTNNLGAGERMVNGLKAVPLPLLMLVGIPVFALVNAFSEEVVYRGIVQESLTRSMSNLWIVIVLQASAFAAVHAPVGFPNGLLGYLMTFSYAATLGYLRVRTAGLLAPYIAHVLADLCIGYFLIYHTLL